MRLVRKAIRVANAQGMGVMLALTLRKILHVLHLRRMQTAYPFHHFELLSGVDPFQPGTIPPPRLVWKPSDSLRLRWYMPEPGRGSGGHRTLFRLIDLLQKRGHRNEVVVMYGADIGKARQQMRAFIAEHFAADVAVLWDTDDLVDVDVVLASTWQSAYMVARDTRCSLRAYVVQDWEPDFYPRGSEQILAENSYRLGHTHIAAGPWLAERLRGLGLGAKYFHLGADQDEYYAGDGAQRHRWPHVVFYARPITARRCFEIGCEALRLLDLELGEGRLTVSMVGARITPFPTTYRALWRGIVPPSELRRLYASADAVLVLSATNPSLVPLEAALCEAPVVDLELPSLVGTLLDGVTGRLSPPTPASLARVLGEVLADPEAASALGRRAREYALGFTWDAAATAVEQHLLDALRAGVQSGLTGIRVARPVETG